MNPFPILFEDDYFVAAAKPAGLSTQATLDKSRPHFFGELKKHYDYLALHHRLDRDTSGVLLFAKRKEANIPLGEMFQKHHIQKTYLCLCALRAGPPQFTVKNHLAPMQKSRKERERMIVVQSGGQVAETHFEVLQKFTRGQLIQAQPRTGRMHQIRVHLSSRGLGIFGDDLYASPTAPAAGRLMLHAQRLQFQHPFTSAQIEILSPLPEDFLRFQTAL
jgi:RluA family pseudouridine synthase